MKKRDGVRFVIIVSLIIFLLLLGQYSAYAQTTTQGGVIGPEWKATKKTFRIQMNAPFAGAASDLHFKIWVKEWNINIQGWRVRISTEPPVPANEFTNSNSALGNWPPPPTFNPNPAHPDNGQHAVDVSADGGNIPPGTWVRIDVALWLSSYNTMHIYDVVWTNAPLPGPGPGPDPDPNRSVPNQGWAVDYPVQNPMDIGEYNHSFCLDNDDTTRYLNISGLAFNSTMDFYDNLTIVIFNPPEYNFNLTPGGQWCKEITTNGSLIGGHIYFKYNISGSGIIEEDWNDHPVTDNVTNVVPSITYGGVVNPVDKLALLTPYAVFLSTITMAMIATAIYTRRVKHRKRQ